MLGHANLSTTYKHYIKWIPSNKDRESFINFNFKGEKDDDNFFLQAM